MATIAQQHERAGALALRGGGQRQSGRCGDRQPAGPQVRTARYGDAQWPSAQAASGPSPPARSIPRQSAEWPRPSTSVSPRSCCSRSRICSYSRRETRPETVPAGRAGEIVAAEGGFRESETGAPAGGIASGAAAGGRSGGGFGKGPPSEWTATSLADPRAGGQSGAAADSRLPTADSRHRAPRAGRSRAASAFRPFGVGPRRRLAAPLQCSAAVTTTDAADRSAGPWKTASMLWPSGSRTKAA